jgi:hypothetical protein
LKKVLSISIATLILCLLLSSLFSVKKEWEKSYYPPLYYWLE